jgi:hypothetical protein
MISPSAGLPLFVFFPIKSLLSATLFFAFVADTGLDSFFTPLLPLSLTQTDMVLCLSYFGCLGWNMKSCPLLSSPHCPFSPSIRYVKVYIHRKREANGGWPLPYGLNPYRFVLVLRRGLMNTSRQVLCHLRGQVH